MNLISLILRLVFLIHQKNHFLNLNITEKIFRNTYLILKVNIDTQLWRRNAIPTVPRPSLILFGQSLLRQPGKPHLTLSINKENPRIHLLQIDLPPNS